LHSAQVERAEPFCLHCSCTAGVELRMHKGLDPTHRPATFLPVAIPRAGGAAPGSAPDADDAAAAAAAAGNASANAPGTAVTPAGGEAWVVLNVTYTAAAAAAAAPAPAWLRLSEARGGARSALNLSLSSRNLAEAGMIEPYAAQVFVHVADASHGGEWRLLSLPVRLAVSAMASAPHSVWGDAAEGVCLPPGHASQQGGEEEQQEQARPWPRRSRQRWRRRWRRRRQRRRPERALTGPSARGAN